MYHGYLSVTMANIFLTKLEMDVVKPSEPTFYKRYVDDVISRRKTNSEDHLLTNLNNYHENINFTVEQSPSKFLDTKIEIKDNKAITSVYRKPNKLPCHWSSKVPKRYKRNTVNGDLNRSYKIGTNFEMEKQRIEEKYQKAGFPPRFVKSVINQFETKLNSSSNPDDFIIPEFLFEIPKKTIMIEIPFCDRNETLAKRFLEKLKVFTQDKFELIIKWSTRKVKSLFPLKDKNPYPACKIYQGDCSCGETYIGETKRNVITRWREHENFSLKSEPAKHLNSFPDHKFEWKIVLNAPKHTRTRKNLEASFIALKKPRLNDQLDSAKLLLFRNGVT